MASLPSLTELGLLGQSPYRLNPYRLNPYSPWWTTLEGDVDDDVFRGHKTAALDARPRKRRAVSPDGHDKPTLALAVPDDADVPELDDSLDALDESPESSPEPSPQTSPETAAADLALPIRRLLPPHYLLPLPVGRKEWDIERERLREERESKESRERELRESRERESRERETKDRDTKRKRDAPARLSLASLLSPTPHVYCLYKFDRVDQLGGKRRGMR